MTEITITMRQIADARPCNNDWKDAPLKALGKAEIDDTPVTFRQIIETSGWNAAIFCLRCLPDSERWRVKLLARSCALHVVHLWNPPQVVKDWLLTGDKNLRALAIDAEWAAARAAWDAEWDAAGAAIGAARAAAWADAEWDAEWDAAGTAIGAARDAARAARAAAWADAAGDAARDAAGDAAGDAERAWQTQEMLRVMSLDYSPEVLILKMPEGVK